MNNCIVDLCREIVVVEKVLKFVIVGIVKVYFKWEVVVVVLKLFEMRIEDIWNFLSVKVDWVKIVVDKV